MNLLAWREQPFTWWRFLTFMGGLVALVALSLATERSTAVSVAPDGSGPRYELLRLGRSVQEIYPELRQIGLPWYLRRADATARFTGDGSNEVAFDIDYRGKPFGRYTERLDRIDENRTKLFIGFEPSDPAAVAELAAPVRSRFAPEDLFRIILKEHVRSELKHEEFDLDTLENRNNPIVALMARFLQPIRRLTCPEPLTDDFPLCEEDLAAAEARRRGLE